MEKKVKFFWIYTIVLFTTAFILILFSAFSGTRFQEEKTETQRLYQGAQKSLLTLTEQYEALLAQNEELKKSTGEMKVELESIKAEAEALKEKNAKMQKAIENMLYADELLKKKEYKAAEELISEVDSAVLEGRAKELYNKLKDQIDKNR